MKTIYLLRHAKSSWKHDVQDHKRPLKKRGRKDATLVSEFVAQRLPAPEHIFTSDATRAKSTARYFKEAFAVSDTHFTKHHSLYDFSGHEVMAFIQKLDTMLNTVMITGHNHALTSIVNMLGDVYFENIPTCGFVAITFKEEDWSKITRGKTIFHIFPKQLKK